MVDLYSYPHSNFTQDGFKRQKMSSGPPPRRYPVSGCSSLPGISVMLQQQSSPERNARMLSTHSPNHTPARHATTPSTSSEGDADHLKLSQTGYYPHESVCKVASYAVPKALAPTSATSFTSTTVAPINKSSRYLREMDRRVILSRIAQGEKQSTLAKEYHVSRAAICNLNKHRDEVLSRKDGNPLAKHPKKPRPKSQKTKMNKSDWAAVMALREGVTSDPNGVHELNSRAAVLLLTTLRKKHATVNEFRRSSDRLMRLVMEEALALVPLKTVEIFLPNHSKSDGVALEHPPCAISMEPAGCPMLDLFHLMEPDQPTGFVTFGDVLCSPPQVKIFDNRMPGSLNYHNVFLLDHVITSPDLVCTVVRRLQSRGAVEAMISLVALIATKEAVDTIHATFPALKIVLAQVDSGEGELTPGQVDVDPMYIRASTTDMILDRLEQVYHGLTPRNGY